MDEVQKILQEILTTQAQIVAMLEALKEGQDNHEEDIRILTEKVEEMDTSYGSGANIEDYGE